MIFYFIDGDLTENVSKADMTVRASSKDVALSVAAGKGDVVKIECYGEFENMLRDEAIAFYSEGIINSEGSERDRYLNIVARLENGKKAVSDRTLPNLVYTERGSVWVQKEFDSKEKLLEEGYIFSFYSQNLGRDLYSMVIDEDGHRRHFAYVV